MSSHKPSQVILIQTRTSKPRVTNNRFTRQAAQDALSFLAFADELASHEFPTSPPQQRRALLGLTRLAVQQLLTARLVAVPLGRTTPTGDPFSGLFSLPLTLSGTTYDDLLQYAPAQEEVPLGPGLLLTAPWNARRYRRALLRSGPEWRSPVFTPQGDQSSVLYLPWGLLCVDNGNHSAASGWLWGDGVLRPEDTADLSPVLALIELTPRGVVRREDGQLIGSSSEWAALALLGLGQRLCALPNDS